MEKNIKRSTTPEVPENKNTKITVKKPKTLLQHIERVIELAEKSKLSDKFYRNAKTSINFIAKAMNLTPNQAAIFSVFIEHSEDNEIRISDLSRFLGCRNIKTICMMNDADELEKRRLLRCKRSERCGNRYRVPMVVVNAVKQSKAYTPKSTKNITTDQLFVHIDRLFEERENRELTSELLTEELRGLLEDNPDLGFCKQMKEIETTTLDDDNEFLLLLFFCHRFINLNDDRIGYNDYEYLYDRSDLRRIESALKSDYFSLIIDNILEYNNDNGFGDREYYRISATYKEKLFAEIEIKKHQAANKKGLILCKDIKPKQLFYNEREQTQIAQLTSLLNKEKFIAVQENLEKNGMRKGFAALFYGAPGTGKTETVYQLAQATQRDIFLVDISETKSMWFGESEKKIKEIFDKYSAFVKTCETAPILLFNEADAVIGKRKDNASGSVAQTENAIQNIILQEMENLTGIMIATTNLTQNLDKAFERRFLYKIEFDNPSLEAKEKIWQTMLPALSSEELHELAKRYNFSGGQIENITRKYTVDAILSGNQPAIETIRNYCETEFLNKDDGRRRIGFMKD
jgi:hypothetical protein